MWVDAASAKTTLGALRPASIQLIPLDATKDVPLSLEYVERLKTDARTTEATFLRVLNGER